MLGKAQKWALSHYWDAIDVEKGPTLKEVFWYGMWHILYPGTLATKHAKEEPRMRFKEN